MMAEGSLSVECLVANITFVNRFTRISIRQFEHTHFLLIFLPFPQTNSGSGTLECCLLRHLLTSDSYQIDLLNNYKNKGYLQCVLFFCELVRVAFLRTHFHTEYFDPINGYLVNE